MIQVSPGTGMVENKRLPHVLLVVDQFPKALGGGERILLKIASLLPGYGFRVSILTFFVHPESPALTLAPCPIYLLPLTRTYDWNAMRAAIVLRRFLRENKVEIVQTFFESSDLWAGFVAKTVPAVSLIWSRRDMGILRSRKHQIAYGLMAKAPDRVFAVSEQVRRHCIEIDKIEAERVLTIYNGIRLDSREANLRSEARDGRVIATVGNVRRIKGHDVLIRAMAEIASRFPDASLQIAGEVLEKDYFAELLSLVEELGLSERVNFVGGVKDVQGFLSGVDIFILPSRSEGFSNAIIEAMAASLPVVATNVGGNAEAVEDTTSGLIVPPEDVHALSEAMTRLLERPAEAVEMGRAGLRIIRERFTEEAMMRRIVEVYRDLIGKGASPSAPFPIQSHASV